MNILWNENRLTDIGNRLVIINGREMGGMDREFGINWCKLLYIYRVYKQQGLLSSKDNYIKYILVNHNENNLLKCIHICIYIK